MADTLEQVRKKYDDVVRRTEEAYNKIYKTRTGRENLTLEGRLALAKRGDDKALANRLQAEFDTAQREYKKLQEEKNSLAKDLKAAEAEDKTAKEREIKSKSIRNAYNKALDNLRTAENNIGYYNGEAKYVEAYRAAEAAAKAAADAGVSVPALPPQKITVPKAEQKPKDVTDKATEETPATYSQFLDTLADPKNKKLLIDVQKDLIKNFGWKGTADGQWSASFQTALQKVEETRGALPTALRTDIRSFILKPTISTKDIVVGGGAGGPKTTTDVTKSIEKMTQADIDAMINKSAQDILGREIVAEDKTADWYKTLNAGIKKMIESGTTYKTTMTTRDGSSTGTRTITPGYSPEKAGQLIESTLKTADPESLARKERIDFVSWMFQNLGGRNG